MMTPSPTRVARRYIALVEDIHQDSFLAELVQEALEHWATQRDYDGPSWAGVLAFNRALAFLVPELAIEAAGWYKYPSSSRPDMDGKDWRYVIPDICQREVPPTDCSRVVVVNCHSLLHDGVWTLSTTTFSTGEVDTSGLTFIGASNDPEKSALLWTLRVAEVLETAGYDYSKAKAELRARLALT